MIQIVWTTNGQPPALKINQENVRWEDLETRLAEIYLKRAEKVAFVRGDADVDFQYVADVILSSRVRDGGQARRPGLPFTLRFHFVGEAQADTIKIMVAWQEFLESNPDISGGEICAAGTRIPVTVILDSLAEGSSKEEILNSYPSLKPEHIEAALAYAAELAHEERLLPIRGK